MLHTYWVGDAMGIFKKHYRMNAKIALNIRIPPFWTDSDMIRDYHTYVFAAKKHLFENLLVSAQTSSSTSKAFDFKPSRTWA